MAEVCLTFFFDKVVLFNIHFLIAEVNFEICALFVSVHYFTLATFNLLSVISFRVEQFNQLLKQDTINLKLLQKLCFEGL